MSFVWRGQSQKLTFSVERRRLFVAPSAGTAEREEVGARHCNDCAHLACTLPATLACSGRCPSPQQATAVARAGLTAAQRRAVARTAARE